MSDNGLRISQVQISLELLIDLFTDGKRFGGFVVSKGLPSGCKFVGAGYDTVRGIYIITVAHPSFDVVRPGDLIPLIMPIVSIDER